jgi:hypothetical protein
MYLWKGEVMERVYDMEQQVYGKQGYDGVVTGRHAVTVLAASCVMMCLCPVADGNPFSILYTHYSAKEEKRLTLTYLNQCLKRWNSSLYALFAWLISHQPTVLFSQNKSATNNQLLVFFSQNKPAKRTCC